jgi:hypothetical protein
MPYRIYDKSKKKFISKEYASILTAKKNIVHMIWNETGANRFEKAIYYFENLTAKKVAKKVAKK